jgi:hypothetical protein
MQGMKTGSLLRRHVAAWATTWSFNLPSLDDASDRPAVSIHAALAGIKSVPHSIPLVCCCCRCINGSSAKEMLSYDDCIGCRPGTSVWNIRLRRLIRSMAESCRQEKRWMRFLNGDIGSGSLSCAAKASANLGPQRAPAKCESESPV